MGGTTAPFSQWQSQISLTLLGASGVQFESITTSNGKIYVIETRPKEQGRGCIIEYAGQDGHDILLAKYNAANRVHEYRGVSIIAYSRQIIFTDSKTQDLHKLDPITSDIERITNTNGTLCYICTIHEFREYQFNQ